MSANCPYCPATPGCVETSWGLSPQGWEELRRRHESEHVVTRVVVQTTSVIPAYDYMVVR